MIVALAGGVGGAKLAVGLAAVLPPEELTIVVNTGDDFEHLGFTICPDLDTVMYTLAHANNMKTGWGRAGEGWRFMQEMRRLGGPDWFQLGDRDQLDSIPKLLCVTQVGHVQVIDPRPRNLRPMHARPEGEMSQDRQLLRGVAAVDVHRRVRLGVAKSLRFRQGRVKFGPLLLHLRNNEVAGAVQDPPQRENLVR